MILYIPCYAVREELGLGNYSAICEKMNDFVVSSRQKHNGMSWSKAGSASLATITAIKRNKENEKWFETKSLNFKLAASPTRTGRIFSGLIDKLPLCSIFLKRKLPCHRDGYCRIKGEQICGIIRKR